MQHPQSPMKAEDGAVMVHPAMSASRHPVNIAHIGKVNEGKLGHCENQIPRGSFSILLSHTPEVYDRAAASGFDLMLSGHTHGGQLCLPGGTPIKLEAILPRAMGARRSFGAGAARSSKVMTSTRRQVDPFPCIRQLDSSLNG
jgi:hypothetical protein